MNQALTLAIKHKQELEQRSNWTLLIIDFTNGERKITLEYGTIHSNGQREVKIATRTYKIYKDKPEFFTLVHV